MTTQTFRIEGMTCASCVRRVEKALASVPGVTGVQVNLATEEASVQGPSVSKTALGEALRQRGYRLIEASHHEDHFSTSGYSRTRVLIAWVLTLPLMAGMLPGLHWHLSWKVQALLSALTAFGTGFPFFARAMRQAMKLEASMDTLIALGAGVSWAFGMHEGMQGVMHPTFETASALISFLLVGKYLEARAKHRATNAIESLLKLAPATAFRISSENVEEIIPTSQLVAGDRIRVKPGGSIPADGLILFGEADVEEALLTGEPLPVPRTAGDRVIAGAIVHGGALIVQVESTGQETWLAKLALQVAEAQGSRAPAQDLADRISAVFVPGILLLAALTLAAWWFHEGTLALAWRPAVTVLVIACPCALGLATPVAMAAALGTAARQGLLVRDATAMDRLSRITDLVFDKTGTLTLGRPMLRQIRSTSELDQDTLLTLAASLERGSEHPIAQGLLQAARHLDIPEVTQFRAFPGGGVSGRVLERDLKLGHSAFLGCVFPSIPNDATAVGLSEEGRLLGIFVLADALRPEATPTVETLRALGVNLHLLSGDRPEVVESLAAQLSIASAQGASTSESKRNRIQKLQQHGAIVAFVGDGVNDAPALAQADAGISLPGLEAAQATAPLNLLRGGLSPLIPVLRLARRTRTIVRQNLLWAFGYNLVLVPLAALNQLDRFGGPMLAGAAMGLSSLTVVLNALRLRKI